MGLTYDEQQLLELRYDGPIPPLASINAPHIYEAVLVHRQTFDQITLTIEAHSARAARDVLRRAHPEYYVRLPYRIKED